MIRKRRLNVYRQNHIQYQNLHNLKPIKPISPPQNTPTIIPMALWNIRSLTTKTFIVNEFINTHNLACLFLTETWLAPNASAALIETCPPSFTFLESHRSDRIGGGTASIVLDSLNPTNLPLGDFTTFEYHAIHLHCKPKIPAITIYRPKHQPSFIDEFTEFLSILHTQFDKFIICGDFNIHVDNPSDDTANDFISLLESMDLVQHVSGPTHNKGHTLDLVITKGLVTTITSVIPPTISDHACILFTIEIQETIQKPDLIVQKRYISPQVADNFNSRLSEKGNTPPHNSSNTHSLVTTFSTKVKTLLDELAPLRTKRIPDKKKEPWINTDITQLKQACRKAERTWKKTNLHIHLDILKNQLFSLNSVIKRAREKYFADFLTCNKNNPRVLFSTIDSLLNPAQKTDLNLPSPSKSEEFALYFHNKIANIRSDISRSLPKGCPATPSAYPVGPVGYPHLTNQMTCFTPPTLDQLRKSVTQLKSSTCPLDPIPTKFFKENFMCMEDDVLALITQSLSSGTFPQELKTALVKPLLKKPNLDPLILQNYRPISNLQFLSKLLEKTVLSQLNNHLKTNNILDTFQSGFRPHHSTETALLKITNDIRLNLDSKRPTILVLLDLSAAFDTIDHNILINTLKNWVGLSGPVLNWFTTYLLDRNYFVMFGGHKSTSYPLPFGVPQGSILGPLLFSLYMLPLALIIRKHNINYHSYADDTQLYISISPDDHNAVNSLVNCITDLNNWLSHNFLKLNQDKTEVLVIGEREARESLITHLESLSFTCTNKAKNLGVILDPNLNFVPHFNSVRKTSYYHLKNIAKILPLINQPSKETLVHAFVTSRLDYCNSLFTGLPEKDLNKLQLIQNAAARLITKTKKRAHIKPVLKSLHWLPIKYRIRFKALLLVFKSFHNNAPSYISDMLPTYTPRRPLRSTGTNLLAKQMKKARKSYGYDFSYFAQKHWNKLPLRIRLSETQDSFKKALKTHLFTIACSKYF